jgi:hypothetical protein
LEWVGLGLRPFFSFVGGLFWFVFFLEGLVEDEVGVLTSEVVVDDEMDWGCDVDGGIDIEVGRLGENEMRNEQRVEVEMRLIGWGLV